MLFHACQIKKLSLFGYQTRSLDLRDLCLKRMSASVCLAGIAGEIEMPAIRGIRAIAHQLHPSLPSSLLPLTGFPELRIHPLFLLKGMQELYAGSVLSEGNFLAINAITPLY